MSLAKNIITFTLISNGIPIIYNGQEQHLSSASDPYNRDAIWLTGYSRTSSLYVMIKALNKLRLVLPSAHFLALPSVLQTTSHVLVYRKNNVVMVVSNLGVGGSETVSVTGTGWTIGTYSMDVLTNTFYKVASDGKVSISVSNGEPRVLVPVTLLQGPGILDGITVPT